MTEKQARSEARRTLGFGYFHDTTNFKVWVRCQHCKRDIHADHAASRPESVRIDALEDALVLHLLEAVA